MALFVRPGAGVRAESSEIPGLDTLDKPVAVKSYASLNAVPPGGEVRLALQLTMSGHWHVNANETNDEFLIPTSVDVEVPPGIEVDRIVYPAGIEKSLDFADHPLLLYEGEALIGVVVTVSPEMQPGPQSVVATVTYQACDNEKCIAPVSEKLEIPLRISSPTEAIDATHAEVFSRIAFAETGAGDAGMRKGGRLAAVIGSRGYFFAFLLVFAWGLGLNLTPCVYPIIPITVGYFGGQSGGSTSRTFLLASLYVLGMAAMYSSLGLFAALTGSLLGTALQNPFVIGIVALFLFALALSMFGAYELRIPMRLSSLAGASSSKGGPIGAFLTGLTVGIVAAPCIGPFVLALLTFVGQSADPVLGFSLFFTLAIGLGLPFLFLAVISGSISKLPKSGEWMEWVKKLFGLILVAMGVYFLEPLLADPLYFALMGGVLVVGGVILGFFKKTQSRSLFFLSFKRFTGIAAPLLGLYLILAPGHIIARGTPDDGIAWSEYDDALLDKARNDQKYVLIDFSAEWCLPCKELDHRTFSGDEVVAATADFVTLRADLTHSASQEVADLRKKYTIHGVPTVVFIDRNGKERGDLRVFGFVDKDEFLERVEKLREF